MEVNPKRSPVVTSNVLILSARAYESAKQIIENFSSYNFLHLIFYQILHRNNIGFSFPQKLEIML